MSWAWKIVTFASPSNETFSHSSAEFHCVAWQTLKSSSKDLCQLGLFVWTTPWILLKHATASAACLCSNFPRSFLQSNPYHPMAIQSSLLSSFSPQDTAWDRILLSVWPLDQTVRIPLQCLETTSISAASLHVYPNALWATFEWWERHYFCILALFLPALQPFFWYLKLLVELALPCGKLACWEFHDGQEPVLRTHGLGPSHRNHRSLAQSIRWLRGQEAYSMV